jgi:REP element-mobilizing transposase RayT
MRVSSFVTNEYYHVYNRGFEKRNIFLCDNDYLRFIESIKEFNNVKPIYSLYLHNQLKKRGVLDVGRLKKLVSVICYCLNPNHFHFILKQEAENGISEFMKRLGGGYAKYFNHKYKRSGFLFQGKFKSIHIDSNSYLLYLSAYINENHFIHGLGKSEEWNFSSYSDYVGKTNCGICKTNIILEQFNNDFKRYEEFSKENAIHLKNRKEDEKYLLE